MELSPSPQAGGIVNLGWWLSLAGQDLVTVRAEAGSLWAEATVTSASTSWDMGNGEVVECDGPGEAIVDTETLDEGPCGYTSRRLSPDEDPYVLSVTATWQTHLSVVGWVGLQWHVGSHVECRLRCRRDPDHRRRELTSVPVRRPVRDLFRFTALLAH